MEVASTQCHACNASSTRFVVVMSLWVSCHSRLIVTQRRRIVTNELKLLSVLTRDEWNLVFSKSFSKLQRCVPLHQITPHLVPMHACQPILHVVVVVVVVLVRFMCVFNVCFIFLCFFLFICVYIYLFISASNW